MSMTTRRNVLRLAASAAALPLLATVARAASHAESHAVQISNFAFSPANLTIKSGDTVVFTNMDSAPHTATAEGAFDTGRLNQGQQASLTFPAPGSYSYICAFHPRMTGTITVT